VISSKAVSPQQGRVALLWEEGHQDFEVEAVTIVSPNLLTFQLVTGKERYFEMGTYIPPTDTTGVDDLRTAWAARPTNWKPLLLGNLNIDFRNPRTEREEIITDFLDEINVVDTSRRFIQHKGRRQGPGAWWTWRQRRGGRWYHSQPDYIMAREVDMKAFRSVGFCQPRFHDSDHRAVVANISRGRKGRLKKYRRSRQKFPLQLAPLGEQDGVTRLFGKLKEECKETDPKQRPWNDWISEETWWLIAHQAMFRRASRLCQMGGRQLHRQIGAALCNNWRDRTARVAESIVTKLAGGNVQEAFRHLKRWYRAASETQSKPCYHTMEHQTLERVDLYAWRQSPGDSLPLHLTPVEIDDDVPTDSKIRIVAGGLTNGRAGGASSMRAEHVKAWLWGVLEEEDPESQGNFVGHGDNWRLFVELVQAVWTHGIIPRQMLWSIVVLIPKGGGDYRGIGLFEPIWKVLERIMDRRLDTIELHDCLHGCRAHRGSGTGVIEAKLAQHIPQAEALLWGLPRPQEGL